MRVFGRVLILGILLVVGPAGADAAPISTVVGGGSPVAGTACTFEGATAACSHFDIGPLGPDPVPVPVTGAFEFDNDIALFGFSVASDVLFTATTSSYLPGDPAGGFDPVLALYDSAGVIVLNGPFPARNDDIIDFVDFNAQLSSVLLIPGSYLLALAQTGNTPQELLENCTPGPTPSDPPECTGGFDQAAAQFGCYVAGLSGADCIAGAPGLFGDLSGTFALELQLDPVTTAVPEPGTLSLLVLSSACAGLARRRRMRRQAG